MKISVIIPVFNEENVIGLCLTSLVKQTRECEIIIVDDGSTDSSKFKVHSSKSHLKLDKLILIDQIHQGPGAARNAGVRHANGDILVFVDADMTFASDFLEQLVSPIVERKSKGTFTKNEQVSNWENVWARCWNFNLGLKSSRRIPDNYPDTAPVFRAILKSEFIRVGGFDVSVGWTDDWTLSRKLGYLATATHASCFHNSPDSLIEVFRQARWIGKNEFFTKSTLRKLWNLLKHSLFMSIFLGIYKSIQFGHWQFLLFKIVYDLAVTVGITSQIFNSHRNK